ncbi:hypothetical protein Mal48_01970 [Thalassoglobus polymorphus]|uniref:Uncharacterized protein n=1 Tax=Thalassoglobus polymorphus TaxID=2527994 RepID=A0A517QH11_9PLAN|nr:hypothetical protein Mal48_01520 [Thalassoglobus polymorphus]QDT30968.1 hypothetical protein Mal48_01970 [Thalassoglobus polymorphus]
MRPFFDWLLVSLICFTSYELVDVDECHYCTDEVYGKKGGKRLCLDCYRSE